MFFNIWSKPPNFTYSGRVLQERSDHDYQKQLARYFEVIKKNLKCKCEISDRTVLLNIFRSLNMRHNLLEVKFYNIL